MELINFLKSNKNTRKVFGKRELKIIEKQLFGVNLTQSEKNRLSRDIRKKLEFIKEISRFSDLFDLKKSTAIKEIINQTITLIKEDKSSNKIKRIILHGSATENKLSLRSDIDIAVEFTSINLKEATLFRKRISGRSHPRADIQVFNILPNKIKKQINQNGKTLSLLRKR